jgi:hypothetical protein
MEGVMPPKPRTASGYDRTHVANVRATCLYLATVIGDLQDELVIVGGLVPHLLIDQAGVDTEHVGTADLDVGLALTILDAKRYQALTERLRGAGFGPDENESGQPTRQRWKIDGPPRVTVDFLIPPTAASDQGGRIKDIEQDFAALIAPGLSLAFLDRVAVRLEARTIRGERAARTIQVCGPGAFVAMKALAFRNRGEPKDAYDLDYVLRFLDEGPRRTADALVSMGREADALRAIAFLREDFGTMDSLGPLRVAGFIHGAPNEEAQADAWAGVRDLLDLLPA